MENPFEQIAFQLGNIQGAIEELKLRLDQKPVEVQPVVESDDPISAKEAAVYLKMSMSSLYQHLKDIPHKKRHGRLYFFRSQLRAYVEDGL